MMSFYVHLDYGRGYVRVHAGSCTYCKEGKASISSKSKNRWYGPYETLEEAQAFAKNLKRRSTRACKLCLPNSKPLYTW
jgi:hypothetical protein